jgi:nicotinamidase-related amidase
MSRTPAPAPSASAVVVVDLANDFVFPGGVIADAGGADYQARAQAIVPTLKKLLDAARETGVTVVFATDAHAPGDTELAKWPPHAMKGTWQAEIVPAVAPKPGDLVIEKSTYSPFVSTGIDAELRRRGITTLYITGLHTDCCARHTSGDAFQRGYGLVWVSDAMQAFTDEAHRQGLDYFRTWYATDADAQVRTADEVISSWRAAAAAAVSAPRTEAISSR